MSLRNWINRWKATWNPDRYHGWGREKHYFEGWYFKLVDPNEEQVIAVIPGISKGADGRRHSFIQVLDGKACRAAYHDFPIEAFSASPDAFQVSVGDNHFSLEGIRLHLPGLEGSLKISRPLAWPSMLGAPGIMGWYSFVPFMECYHGVVSLHHEFTGSLRIQGKPVDFSGGKGYIEKDWGVSFPRSWIWMQSNHFDTEQPACLVASVAHIPWRGGYFIGFITGFLLGGELYRFATYLGSERKVRLEEEAVWLEFRKGSRRLVIHALQAPGAALVSPIIGEMTGKVNESMQARLHVWFYEKDRLVFEGTGRNAGLEVAGSVTELLSENWVR